MEKTKQPFEKVESGLYFALFVFFQSLQADRLFCVGGILEYYISVLVNNSTYL